MPNWKKVVTSGSNAVLNQVTASKFIGDGSALTNLPSQTGTITALNNQSANRLVTIGSTTTELDGEAGLIFDGSNLGIGETSPSATLHVAKSGNHGIVRIAGDTNKDSTLQLYSDRLWVIQNDGDGSLGTADYLHIYDNTAGASRIAIDTSGNVGIGTTSPATNAKLHVVDGAGTAPTMHTGDMAVFQNNDNTSDNAGIVVVSGTGSGTSNGLSYITFGDSSVKNQGGMIYYNGNDSLEIRTGATAAINIDSSQNVGIGTTSPSVKLEVVGAISGSALVSKQTAASMTGANNVDLSTSANHNITITGNITLTPTNFSARLGQSGIITLIQDSSGGHSITLNSLFKTPRGDSIAFDTTADGISLMSYYVIDASNVAVNYLGPFS